MKFAPELFHELVLQLLIRLGLDLLTLLILLRVIYFKAYNRKDLFFTFVIFNVVLFLVCFFLNRIELSMGAAFGLFAVFGMLRYRTEDVSVRDMSYLFFVISLGLLHAVIPAMAFKKNSEYVLIAASDVLALSIAALLEFRSIQNKERVALVVFERLDLLKPELKADLIFELKQRMGLNIQNVQLLKIDFSKNSAQLKVFYTDKPRV
jgi:thiol:disulfide interchange protein